ncbi:hypothetical protein MXD62_16950 [Frankia sp. Mgl5]|uniref:hypothetical protein n=1 Tax=Frankia sp. Mgl5 TaxID=2933793 RepID=UPI002010933F|nr:hypothetical protein [Frankia sp. Mgl5]MCK9928846.1 hypothetical protein [Frankia sp. Mgl5]
MNKIEKDAVESQRVPKFDPAHRGYVIGSITASCMFLEAMINEILQDIYDHAKDSKKNRESDYIAPLSASTRRMLAWMWNDGKLEQLPALQKLDAVLVADGHEPFEQGRQPYQDVALVVEIRNALIHYKPQTLGGDQVHRLERKLRGKSLTLNPLTSSGNPYFPDQVLGFGCTNWAWRSCKALADEFSTRLGIEPNYRRADFVAQSDESGQ